MNGEKLRSGSKLGRGVIAAGVGVVLALVSPASLLLSALVLIVVYRWAGIWPMLVSAVCQLFFGVRYLGMAYLWMEPLLALMPVALLIAFEKKPFFTQMKLAIGGFGAGMLGVVVALYLQYGSNLIESLLTALMQQFRNMPQDTLGELVSAVAQTTGRQITLADFYQALDRVVAYLIPLLQRNLPGMLMSMALFYGVVCTWLSNWMRKRSGTAPEGCYLPPREWYLPASTTGGLVMLVAAGYALLAFENPLGDAALQTALYLALTAFTIQALCSVQRRCHAAGMKPGNRTACTVLVAAMSFFGGFTLVGSYGFASAIAGSKGVLQQYMEHKKNNNSRTDGEE